MAEIPVYKERRMYGVKDNEECSYKIKDSYAGILRLSPNNSASLIEANNLVSAEGVSRYVNYEDSITHDLSNQFIRLSTSDGVLLDLRISNNAIEYNNLYIQGALKSDKGIICHLGEDDNFFIDGNAFPCTYNNVNLNEGTPDLQYVPLDREKLNDGYILVNMAESGKQPVFEYVNAYDLINRFVTDSLLKLSLVPTGSIHWMPLTIKQYQELLRKTDNYHNCNSLNADSVIRDFLLCDGSQYKITDFPELAKILKGEQITYWNYDTANSSSPMIKNVQSEAVNTTNGTFRVPDLRSMFIQYVIPTFDKTGAQNNVVGDYEIDAAKDPRINVAELKDKHYHYIVLDNTHVNNSNTSEFSNSKITFASPLKKNSQGAYETDSLGRMKFNPSSSAKPLARFGSGRNSVTGPVGGGAGGGGCDQRSCNYWGVSSDSSIWTPPSYIYAPTFSSRNCTVGGDTCGYILCNTKNKNYAIKINSKLSISDYVGLSSWDVDMSIPVDGNNSANAANNNINYTKDTTIYKKAKTYVDYTDGANNMIGKDNAPEYFACLPLIKI